MPSITIKVGRRQNPTIQLLHQPALPVTNAMYLFCSENYGHLPFSLRLSGLSAIIHEYSIVVREVEMSLGPWQIALIALVVILLFGAGKLPRLMGDAAKGINAFKKNLKDDKSDPPMNRR